MFEEHEPNDEVGEVIRILFKANQFREFSEMSGMPKVTQYPIIKLLYEDFECMVGFRYYLEMYPYIENIWINTIINNHKK